LIQQDELKTIRSEIHENSIVFDVGANRGDWGIEILKLDRGCNLFCFEPNEKIIQELDANLSIYHYYQENPFSLEDGSIHSENLENFQYSNFLAKL
jgi:FkbM family methyltransferase